VGYPLTLPVGTLVFSFLHYLSNANHQYCISLRTGSHSSFTTGFVSDKSVELIATTYFSGSVITHAYPLRGQYLKPAKGNSTAATVGYASSGIPGSTTARKQAAVLPKQRATNEGLANQPYRLLPKLCEAG
jgi:hypothetical protein